MAIQCNLTQPNQTKTKTIGFDTIEINLVDKMSFKGREKALAYQLYLPIEASIFN